MPELRKEVAGGSTKVTAPADTVVDSGGRPHIVTNAWVAFRWHCRTLDEAKRNETTWLRDSTS